jgi:hypothetical protein
MSSILCNRALGKSNGAVRAICCMVEAGIPFALNVVGVRASVTASWTLLLESIGCTVGADGKITFTGTRGDEPPHFFEVFNNGSHVGSAQVAHSEYIAMCAQPSPFWHAFKTKLVSTGGDDKKSLHCTYIEIGRAAVSFPDLPTDRLCRGTDGFGAVLARLTSNQDPK